MCSAVRPSAPHSAAPDARERVGAVEHGPHELVQAGERQFGLGLDGRADSRRMPSARSIA